MREFSAKERKQIEEMIGLGITVEDTARVFDCDDKTLRKHCKKEVECGKTKALVKVAKKAYTMAVSGDVPAMTMFWLKTQGGFRETNRTELTTLKGQPVEINYEPSKVDFSTLTDEELEFLEKIHAKANANSKPGTDKG